MQLCRHCQQEYDSAVIYFMCPNLECRQPFFHDIEYEETVPEPTERILHLVEACENVANERWTLPEFQEYMTETFIPQLKEKEFGILELEIPMGLEEDFTEEMNVGLAGVEQCNRATDKILTYDPAFGNGVEVLTEGLKMFFLGISAVKNAMRINRRNRDRPVWI
jgi:hypothetical protein